MRIPNNLRVTKGIMASDDSYGNNGVFILNHPKIDGYKMNCIVSDGDGWEHVSITLSSMQRKVDRCPTWAATTNTAFTYGSPLTETFLHLLQ